MLNYNHPQPILQRPSRKMIRSEMLDPKNQMCIGKFHEFMIVHPVAADGGIFFMYLYIISGKPDCYFVFKPAMNRRRETVSIIFEMGSDADYEMAGFALLQLLNSTLLSQHPPMFETPGLETVMGFFEETKCCVQPNSEWEWWKGKN